MPDRTREKSVQVPTDGTDRAVDLSHVRRRVRPESVATELAADGATDIETTVAANTRAAQTSTDASKALQKTIIKTKHGRKEVAYETGYGLPPKSGRFKPGQSGNRKGRPKGSVNLRKAMEDLYHRQTEIRRNGKTVKMPLYQVILELDAMKAASGEAKAIQRVRSDILKLMGFEEARIAEGKEVGPQQEAATPVDLTESERRILRHHKKVEYAALGFAEDDIQDLLDLDFGSPRLILRNGSRRTPSSGRPRTLQRWSTTASDSTPFRGATRSSSRMRSSRGSSRISMTGT
jgi:hypothetical protein